MSGTRERGPNERPIRGTIGAADVAAHEEEWDLAKEALLAALAKVEREANNAE